MRANNDRLEISGANAVTILFSNATSYRNFQDVRGDALGTAQGYLQRAEKRTYVELRQRHLKDFHDLFSRVRLNLGEDHATETTDQRIKNFAQNDDPSLLALYFEFGRYLLISSSRPGGLPANLQGIWNQDLSPAWSSKFTTNINLEMNYWQADTGDLWETQEPLWNLIRELRVSGARTARTEYHSDGWVLHHKHRYLGPPPHRSIPSVASGLWGKRGSPTRCGTTTSSVAIANFCSTTRIRQ